jgi:putative multiple sugar transport system permease protein
VRFSSARVTQPKTGTIIIPNKAFNAIGNGFIPDIPLSGILPGVHKATLILGIIITVSIIVRSIQDRKKLRPTTSRSCP